MRVLALLTILFVVLAVVELSSAQDDDDFQPGAYRGRRHRRRFNDVRGLDTNDDRGPEGRRRRVSASVDVEEATEEETTEAEEVTEAATEAETTEADADVGGGETVTPKPKPLGLIGKVIRMFKRLFMLLKLLIDQLMGD